MTTSEDPYADFRDNKGRFEKGNPGGPGRPRKWYYEDEIIKEWKILIEKPPRCICGCRKYRYQLKDSVLYCLCDCCSEEYVFDAYQNQWAQSKFAVGL